MVRFLIIGAVIAAAFTLYGLVDAAMTDAARARALPKPVWVVLVVLLPVIGAILWFAIGKHRGPLPASARVRAPDDDPRFTGTRLSDAELDERVEELEARLRQLDDEVFPGEQVEPAAPQDDADAAEGAVAAETTEAAEANGAAADAKRDPRERRDNGSEESGSR